MTTRILKQVDAFTSHPFEGNPAGVVMIAEGLSDDEMQLIAREKNLPETAFVLPPSSKQADLRIRWFTPTNEVDLCGHATIGSFHALAEEGMIGMLKDGMYKFRVETRSGILSVLVEKSSGDTFVELEIPVAPFKRLDSIPEDVRSALRIRKEDIDARLPVVQESYLYIPVRSRAALFALNPDFHALADASRAHAAIGISVLTLETVEPGSAVHSRFFAPAVGISEDPVTGSANGPLGAYLHSYLKSAGLNAVSKTLSDGRTEYVGEQGDVLRRPGRVLIRVSGKAPGVQGVAIAGRAVTVLQSTLYMKDQA